MQFQICNSGEVWTSVSAAEAHRIVRKRIGALAMLIRGARKAEKQEKHEYRRAERGLQQELREADRRSRALWKRIRVKPEARVGRAIERKSQAHRPTRSGWLAAASQLPRYSGQVIDRAGRAGIFFRVRYYSKSTRAGVGRRATLYIWQGAYETADGRILFESNVGETAEEATAALEAIELFNREAQENAKVLFHAIANVPYQLIELDRGIESMFEIGRRFAQEQLGDRDLPFALALHPPSDKGDQRNWHLHLLFSTRPLVRTGDHEWEIGRMLRREIDNPEAFEAMRHLYAAVQTEVVQEAGLNILYTARSNVERGLPIPPQRHLGSARTARVRRGKSDAVNERNWEKSLAGEAALLDEQLRHGQETVAARMALIDRVEERAAPLMVAKTTAPALSVAAPLRPVRAMPAAARAAAGIHGHESSTPMILAIANLQPVARPIAAVPAMAAITEASASPPMPSLPAVRIQQYRLRTVPKFVDQEAAGNMPPLSIAIVTKTRSFSAISAPASSRLASLAAEGGMSREMALSTGIARYRPDDRGIDVPREAKALNSDAADQDLQHVFRLLEQREAEEAARRDRLRRERVEQQHAEAERLRQEQDEERKREEERQGRAAEDALRAQAEREAAEALDSMLTAINVERILISFDRDDQYVVGHDVCERFGVSPAMIVSGEAQARLDVIAGRQSGEIVSLATHLGTHAGHAVHRAGGWTLSAGAPADLRRIADAWRHEPVLQRAFADTAAAFRAAQKPMPQAAVPVPAKRAPARRGVGPARPGPRLPPESAARRQLLALAAAQRETLARQWEQDGGLNDTQTAPGPVLERNQPSPPPAPARQLFPPDRGQGR